MTFDLVTLGEPLLRLSPPKFGQLRQASSLDVYVVGSQLNVAANFARLGGRSAFATRLPEGPLGDLAIDACRGYGVDVSLIKRVPSSRMGVTYVEFSAAPRAATAVYDRALSAAGTTGPGDFDWPAIMTEASIAHTDGIFPGLGASCFEAALAFLESARRQGRTTSFDVNYREHLWTPSEARTAWSRLLPNVDLLTTNRGVSEQVFGYHGDDRELMRSYADEFGCRLVALTSREMFGLARGAWTSQALTKEGLFQGRRQEFEIVDRYGTGDAWLAGFLYTWQKDSDVALALDFANALCALAHTIEGDVAHVTPDQVRAIMGDAADLRLKR